MVPSGKNFDAARVWLAEQSIEIPEMSGRCYFGSGLDRERKRLTRVLYARDKDIPTNILDLGGLGVVGSDVLGELPDDTLDALNRYPIAQITKVNPNGPDDDVLRFVLMCRIGEAQIIRRRLKNGKQVRIGTSYPRQAVRMLGNQALLTKIVYGGGESLPGDYDPNIIDNEAIAVDAVIELDQTGSTRVANKLKIVPIPGRENFDDSVWLEAITRNPRANDSNRAFAAPPEGFVWNGMC